MEIKFALNISDSTSRFKKVFDDVENKVNALISNQQYGNDLLTIYVGWICVTTEYEPFFKPRRPKYYQNKEMSVDGRPFFLINTLEYEIKLDYAAIHLFTLDQFGIFIEKQLITTLISTIMKNKKIKDFNADLLFKDLETIYLCNLP